MKSDRMKKALATNTEKRGALSGVVGRPKRFEDRYETGHYRLLQAIFSQDAKGIKAAVDWLLPMLENARLRPGRGHSADSVARGKSLQRNTVDILSDGKLYGYEFASVLTPAQQTRVQKLAATWLT